MTSSLRPTESRTQTLVPTDDPQLWESRSGYETTFGAKVIKGIGKKAVFFLDFFWLREVLYIQALGTQDGF